MNLCRLSDVAGRKAHQFSLGPSREELVERQERVLLYREEFVWCGYKIAVGSYSANLIGEANLSFPTTYMLDHGIGEHPRNRLRSKWQSTPVCLNCAELAGLSCFNARGIQIDDKDLGKTPI